MSDESSHTQRPSEVDPGPRRALGRLFEERMILLFGEIDMQKEIGRAHV